MTPKYRAGLQQDKFGIVTHRLAASVCTSYNNNNNNNNNNGEWILHFIELQQVCCQHKVAVTWVLSYNNLQVASCWSNVN